MNLESVPLSALSFDPANLRKHGVSFALASEAFRDVFAIEWGPGWISWLLDGVEYHHATPADVAPNRWVFDHPFYLVLNVAVGGNLGGLVSPETTFPQTMLVDYVRIYEGAE